jgi:hypothetical protein
MSRKCRECKIGNLEILGTAGFGDTISVECNNPNCGECYEVEPDGLGEGGMEFVDAQMIDLDNGIDSP